MEKKEEEEEEEEKEEEKERGGGERGRRRREKEKNLIYWGVSSINADTCHRASRAGFVFAHFTPIIFYWRERSNVRRWRREEEGEF